MLVVNERGSAASDDGLYARFVRFAPIGPDELGHGEKFVVWFGG